MGGDKEVIAEFLFWIYAIVLISGAFLVALRFSVLRPRHLRILLALFSATVAVELVGRYVLDRPNIWWYNLFLPVEYLLFTSLYYFDFASRKKRIAMLIGSVGLLAFSVVNILWIQGINDFNTYTVLLSGALTLVWTFFSFHEILQREEPAPLLRQSMFWISSGLLIFYLGNIFVAGTMNYFIREDMEVASVLLQFIKLLNIVSFSLFIVAVLCQTRPGKS